MMLAADTAQANVARSKGTAAVQGDLWGARARDYAELQEESLTPLYRAVLRDLAVGKETRLLDIGCGAGLAVKIAAGEGAVVSGLDAAGPFIEIARERSPIADLRVGEMEELPF